MVWDKELGLVQHWQLFLPFIAFNDDLGREQRGGLSTVYSAPTPAGKAEVRPHHASPWQNSNKRSQAVTRRLAADPLQQSHLSA